MKYVIDTYDSDTNNWYTLKIDVAPQFTGELALLKESAMANMAKMITEFSGLAESEDIFKKYGFELSVNKNSDN